MVIYSIIDGERRQGTLPKDIVDDGRDYAAICALLSGGHPVFLTRERQWIFPEVVYTTLGMQPLEKMRVDIRQSGDGSPGTVDMYSVRFVVKEIAHGVMNGIQISSESVAQQIG